MPNKKGFTLLELLIAATIVGILVIFASVSYKNSAADVRIAGAKTRLDMLANAVQRFSIDHENVSLPQGKMQDLSSTSACSLSSLTNPYTPLINCKYVENGGWSDSYVGFYVCSGSASGVCADAPVASPLACLKGTTHARLPAQYKGNYMYCVSAVAKGEQFGS